MYSISERSKKTGRLGIAPLVAEVGLKVGSGILKSIFGGGKNNNYGLPNDVWEKHLKYSDFFRYTWTSLKSFKNKPETAGELPQGWTTADLYFNQFIAPRSDYKKLITSKSPGGNGITKSGKFEYFDKNGNQLWQDNQITQPEFMAAVNEAYGVQPSIISSLLPSSQTVKSTASALTSGAAPYILGAAALVFIMMKGK